MLEDEIKKFPSKTAFCLAIGMKPQFLTQIENSTRPIPPKYALAIERVTEGRVSRHQLRPDIYPD
jgi:DNA-binding transcriptional regulator YdaS (Cro superfamily)